MMNRREFVSIAVAGAAAIARTPNLLSAEPYDLVIRGGRVIDPSRGLDAIRDVGIAKGRIAAVQSNLSPGAAESIDARGKLVVPGLIDVHSHAGRVREGPALCLADGVTGFIDAGSQGADRIPEILAVVKTAPQRARVLLNI